VPRGRDDNAFTTFGRPAPKISQGPKKRPNFGAISDNFRLWSQISPEWIDISNIWEKNLISHNPFHVGRKKTLVNFGPQTKKFYWLMLTNPRRYFFWKLHFSHYWVLRPEIFKRARDWPRLPSAHPSWDGGPPPKKKNYRKNLKLGLKFNIWASITSGLVGVSSWNFSRRRDAR